MEQDFWNKKYLENDIPWDISAPSPPLKAYIDQLEDKSTSILIPGAGMAHEAIYLFENGFQNIFICDWAEAAIHSLAKRLPALPAAQLICGNFFKLQLKVNIILEQTFFCAIPRQLRQDYARKAAELLQYDGKLAGVLFASEFEKEGPPFGGTAAEYEQYFSPYFDILHLAPCYNSLPPRMGNELFIEFIKK